MIEGFDVSHWQDPAKFDWEALKKRGTRFIVARASYGKGTADRNFVRFAELVREHGFTFGAYHYYRQIHSVDEQLALFRKQLDAIGGLHPGDMYPVLDLEENSTNGDGRPNPKTFHEAATNILAAWNAEFGGAILYYSSFFPEYLKPYAWDWPDTTRHWLADYSSEPGKPRTPYTLHWHLHQPRPAPVPEYASGTAPIDRDVFNPQLDVLAFDQVVIQPADMPTTSPDAEDCEIAERPGGCDPLDVVAEGAHLVRQGLELIEKAVKS